VEHRVETDGGVVKDTVFAQRLTIQVGSWLVPPCGGHF